MLRQFFRVLPLATLLGSLSQDSLTVRAIRIEQIQDLDADLLTEVDTELT